MFRIVASVASHAVVFRGSNTSPLKSTAWEAIASDAAEQINLFPAGELSRLIQRQCRSYPVPFRKRNQE